MAHSALGRVNLEAQAIEPLLKQKDGMWGIRPRNREQSFACDILLNDNVKIVTLVGKAGTGKTLLAIAAGAVATWLLTRLERRIARSSRPMSAAENRP